MPVCNKCKKFSNCLTVDFCEHCGAKDWDKATVLTFSDKPERELSNKTYNEMTHDEILSEHGRRYAAQTHVAPKVDSRVAPKADSNDIGCLTGIFLLVFLFAGLWLLVAAVKWMWQHS